MKNIIQDTIAKIEKQHIEPAPRWKYLLRKYGLWMIFIAVLILTAISLSVLFDNANNLDWDLYHFMPKSRFAYILSILPYFWIILCAIFLVVAFFEVRKTEIGYRYSRPKIALMILGGSLIFGILVSLLGFGARLNSKLTKNIPAYSRHIVVTRESQWMRPQEGFLAGMIMIVSENKFEIRDLGGKEWNVSIDRETLIRPSVNIHPEETVKLIGKKVDENNFKAKEIRPWAGQGRGGGRNGRMMK